MSHEVMLRLGELFGQTEQYRTPLLFLMSLAIGFCGAWLIAGIPFRKHLLDHPNDRSSHEVPTPRGGGVGILGAFAVAGITLGIPTHFLFAVILVSCISLYGDFFPLSVRFRLGIQFFSALIVLVPLVPQLYHYFDFHMFSMSSVVFIIVLFLILLYVVGTANFFNFMDGINGIAGVAGVIAFGLLGVYTLYQLSQDAYHTALSLLAICIALACLGFLPFNIPHAKVFAGDVGSILLGFVFAVLVVALARNFSDIVCFSGLLLPFYADALTTLYVRFRAEENLFEPHRRHLYQLLANEFRIAHWKVAVGYGAAQLVIGAGVLATCTVGIHMALLVVVISFFLFTVVTYNVRKRVELLQESAPANRAIRYKK
ncbi:MAG: glycosyltransferase family 4 protein [Syntrophales bacterium]|jgi:Fuc2NAc and GlcNAc transferase|nr:glycosyltransferase family 4 protein [Syntrophales bacterium]MDX9922929.1 glycosyltransferase family 4 protein [Syntrophales bacterium]